MVSFSRFVQPLSIFVPIVPTLSGITSSVSDVQFANALLLIFFTPFEIAMSDKLVQFSNAEVPIVKQFLGIATDFEPLSLNALLPILTTASGIFIFVIPLH